MRGVVSHVRGGIVEDSVLLDPEVDPRAVRRELDAIDPWLPLAAIRFSRAF